jgi:hypothetical protein
MVTNNFTKTILHRKKIYLSKGGDNGIYADGIALGCKPGDTLVLKASNNPYTLFFYRKYLWNRKLPGHYHQ